MYQLRWEVIDETNPEVETILDVYPIGNFDKLDQAADIGVYLKLKNAKCPNNIKARLKLIKVN